MPNSALYVPILAVAAVQFLGVAWSDSLVPNKSILVLPLYLTFVLLAPSLIEDRRDIDRIVGAILLAAVLLSLAALAQRAAGVFQWRDVLIQSDAYSYRANATFADPNILGRFLAISVALAAGAVLATGPRRLTIYLAVPALIVGPPALVATASRSGWLALLLCGFLVVLASPIPRYRKALLTCGAAAGVALLLGLVLAQGGTDAERVRSISQAWNIVGQRSFLIRAGWEMFKDSPLIGIGAGNYQHALVTTYLDYIPDWARTTLSHTSFISLLAELGLLGILALSFAGIRTAATVASTYFAWPAPYHRLLAGWVGAALVTFLLHSQSEGRFFEEPYLWVLLSLAVALEVRGPRLTDHSPGRVRPQPASSGDACSGRGPEIDRTGVPVPAAGA